MYWQCSVLLLLHECNGVLQCHAERIDAFGQRSKCLAYTYVGSVLAIGYNHIITVVVTQSDRQCLVKQLQCLIERDSEY